MLFARSARYARFKRSGRFCKELPSVDVLSARVRANSARSPSVSPRIGHHLFAPPLSRRCSASSWTKRPAISPKPDGSELAALALEGFSQGKAQNAPGTTDQIV